MKNAFRSTLIPPSSALVLALGFAAGSAQACGPEPYVGTVCTFGFNYCPTGYEVADGHLLQVTQNQVLFALIGNVYGGDGRTTFAVPDLRGRSAVGTGTGAGFPTVILGQKIGAASTTLTSNQMPAHTHAANFTPSGASSPVSVSVTLQAASVAGADNSTTPSTTTPYLSASGVGQGAASIWNKALTTPVNVGGVSATTSGGGSTGGTVTVGIAGGNQPFSIQSPALGLTTCIASQGVWPQRP